MIRRGVAVLVVQWTILLLLASPAFATKTDIVLLHNGDRLTGEIKGLERGKLTFKTDATDKIQITWTDVEHLEGSEWFRIELDNGDSYFGRLAAETTPRLMRIASEDSSITVSYEDVVFMTPIEQSFWKRVDGSIDLGFSYTQADNHFQLSTSATSTYRTEKYLTSLSLSSILSVDQGAERTSRHDLAYRLTRLLPNRFLVTGDFGLQSNEDLGIRLRLLLGATGGLYLLQSGERTLEVSAGLTLNRETSQETHDVTENPELVLGAEYSRFAYNTPQRDVTVTWNNYVSLTDGGRYRLEFSVQTRWEVVSDFFVGLSLLESFDNRPPAGGTGQNDLSLTTSVGYSF